MDEDGSPAATVYAVVSDAIAACEVVSAMCSAPLMVDGGKPVTDVPG